MSSIRAALARAREFDRELLDTPRVARQASPVLVERPLPASAEPSSGLPSQGELLAMSYEEFAKADLVLLVRSAVLGDDIALASSDEAARRAPREMVVYILDELRKFYVGGTLDVDALKALHRLKKRIGDARVICENEDGRGGRGSERKHNG